MQEKIFKDSEADEWFYRNKEAILKKEPNKDLSYRKIADIVQELDIKNILEIGCCNGYRLNWISENLNVSCTGIEPSHAAIEDGKARYNNKNLHLICAGAEDAFWQNDISDMFAPNSFDLILFGHCLYLITPELYFSIVMQTNRLLSKEGFVAIFDFDSYPQRKRYHHYAKFPIWSYKMDFSSLFTSHPMYKLIFKEYVNYSEGISTGNPHNDCSLALIRKIKEEFAFVDIT